MPFERTKVELTEEEKAKKSLEDFDKAGKRLRRNNIIACIVAGVFAAAFIATGLAWGFGAFFAINFALSVGLIGSLAGVGITSFLSRRHKNLKKLQEAKILQDTGKTKKGQLVSEDAKSRRMQKAMKEYEKGDRKGWLDKYKKEYLNKTGINDEPREIEDEVDEEEKVREEDKYISPDFIKEEFSKLTVSTEDLEKFKTEKKLGVLAISMGKSDETSKVVKPKPIEFKTDMEQQYQIVKTYEMLSQASDDCFPVKIVQGTKETEERIPFKDYKIEEKIEINSREEAIKAFEDSSKKFVEWCEENELVGRKEKEPEKTM